MSRNIIMHLPLHALELSGDPDDARLHGTATILGTSFHLEAVPVVEDTVEEMQVGLDEVSESRMQGMVREFGVPGFATVRIGERDYVLFITPFGL